MELYNTSLISNLVSRFDVQFTCWRSPVVLNYFRDYRNVQGAGRPGCDAVSLGTGLQAFWTNELPTSSSGRQFKKNLTASTWRWKHYLLRNISNHSPNAPNPRQDRCENLKPRTWEWQWGVIQVTMQRKPITGLDRPWGLQEVEAPRFQDSRHMEVVRLSALRTGRLYPPGNIPGTHFC